LPAAAAERLLLEKASDGEFLIRKDMVSREQHVLTFRDHGRVGHTPVVFKFGCFCVELSQPQMAATSLAALVEVLAGKTLTGLSVKMHRPSPASAAAASASASADISDTVEVTVVLQLPFSMAGARRQHRQQQAAAQEAREAVYVPKQQQVAAAVCAMAASADAAAAATVQPMIPTTPTTPVSLRFDASNPFADAMPAP
jgi:hypothetical protein